MKVGDTCFTISDRGSIVDNSTPAWISILDINFVDKAPVFVDKFAPLWITWRTIVRHRRGLVRRQQGIRDLVHGDASSYRREIHSHRAEPGALRRQIQLALHSPRLYDYGFYESHYYTW